VSAKINQYAEEDRVKKFNEKQKKIDEKQKKIDEKQKKIDEKQRKFNEKQQKLVDKQNSVISSDIHITTLGHGIGCKAILKTGINKGKECCSKIFQDELCKRHYNVKPN
jgi:lipase chaperone LimK